MLLVSGARIAAFGAVCTAIGSTIIAACGGGGQSPPDGGGYGYRDAGGGYGNSMVSHLPTGLD